MYFHTSAPKPLDWSKPNFYMDPLWVGGMKVYSNDPGHLTKMAATSIYGKNVQNLLQNQKADELETWYRASGTQSLQSLFK